MMLQIFFIGDGDNLHEMSNLSSGENKKNVIIKIMLFAEFFTRVLSVKREVIWWKHLNNLINKTALIRLKAIHTYI